MKWVYLLLSIICEVLGTSALKYASMGGAKAVWGIIATTGFYVACFWLMMRAMRYFDLGIMYSTWCGLGIALVAVMGVLFFGDELTAKKVLFMSFIIVGIIGLNLSGSTH